MLFGDCSSMQDFIQFGVLLGYANIFLWTIGDVETRVTLYVPKGCFGGDCWSQLRFQSRLNSVLLPKRP